MKSLADLDAEYSIVFSDEFLRRARNHKNVVDRDDEALRARIILLAAYIDDHLRTLVAASLPSEPTSQLERRLFDGSHGALRSLGPRIDVAEALDIISADRANYLREFKRARNAAAHRTVSGNLLTEDRDVKKAIGKLRRWCKGDQIDLQEETAESDVLLLVGVMLADKLALQIESQRRLLPARVEQDSVHRVR